MFRLAIWSVVHGPAMAVVMERTAAVDRAPRVGGLNRADLGAVQNGRPEPDSWHRGRCSPERQSGRWSAQRSVWSHADWQPGHVDILVGNRPVDGGRARDMADVGVLRTAEMLNWLDRSGLVKMAAAGCVQRGHLSIEAQGTWFGSNQCSNLGGIRTGDLVGGLSTRISAVT